MNKETKVVTITDGNYEEILKSELPVVIDFWAEWCGPCRMVGPIIDDLAKDYEGKAIIGKVDVDSNPVISTKYGIRNIPAIFFFKEGELKDKQIGAVPKSVFANKIDKLIV